MTSTSISKLRHLQILDFLKSEPLGLVRDLAAHFDVSESTIRRDLEELEDMGLLRRIHGGAMLEQEREDHIVEAEPPFALRQVSHEQEKDLVGRAAGEWVADGDVIFIDGGTTTQFIVPYLMNKRDLTVVTCGLNIAAALSVNPRISTIVIGGELHVESQSMTGPMALEALDIFGIRCDKSFISAGGISARHGITNRILDRIPIKRKVMEISQQVAIVADGSKVGLATLGHVGPIDSAYALITDPSAPLHELDAIRAHGVSIKMVD